MKLSRVLLALSLAISFSSYAEMIVTGEEAKILFENVKGYEYSTGAKTYLVEYKLTVRHNDQISCEKEETFYSNESTVEYTCILK